MKVAAIFLLGLSAALAFVPAPVVQQPQAVSRFSRRAVTTMMAEDPMRNRMRSARKPGPNDRVVELQKPLGIQLEEDEKGNVYVLSCTPGGNAARSGKVNKGDQITMISATFGDEMWSARGAGLGMIMQAIKVRQGNMVSIVLEKSSRSQPEKKAASNPFGAKKPAASTGPAKSQDQLLKELEAEEKGRKKFFGLF